MNISALRLQNSLNSQSYKDFIVQNSLEYLGVTLTLTPADCPDNHCYILLLGPELFLPSLLHWCDTFYPEEIVSACS